MKQIIFTVTFIFAFCFPLFAQSNSSQPEAIKVSEYKKDYYSEDIKFAIIDLSKHLQSNLSGEGIIKIQADNGREILKQIITIKYALKYRGIEQNRISFAIANNKDEIIQYWFIPKCMKFPDCQNCLIFRAEDFDKLFDLFYPKPISKKSKK